MKVRMTVVLETVMRSQRQQRGKCRQESVQKVIPFLTASDNINI